MTDRPTRPRKPTKKITQQFEVTYMFHPTERWLAEHWIYCEVTGSSPENCRENAKKYYENQMKSLGWTKITTLKSIGPLRHVNDPHPVKTNNESNNDSSSNSNGSKSGDGRKSNRKDSGDTKRPNSRTKSSTTSSKESGTNRKNARPNSSGKPKATGGRSNTTRKKRS